jgi:hypothetical protein
MFCIYYVVSAGAEQNYRLKLFRIILDHHLGIDRDADISTGNKGDWPAIVTAFRNAGANPGQTACDNSGTLLPSSRCNEANHIHVAF